MGIGIGSKGIVALWTACTHCPLTTSLLVAVSMPAPITVLPAATLLGFYMLCLAYMGGPEYVQLSSPLKPSLFGTIYMYA